MEHFQLEHFQFRVIYRKQRLGMKSPPESASQASVLRQQSFVFRQQSFVFESNSSKVRLNSVSEHFQAGY